MIDGAPMKLHYELWYRFGTPPWVGPARTELVKLVDDGVLQPGRAIDLGCGEGDNAVFLARNGFQVTGVDQAGSAIRKAREKARAAEVEVTFVVDDLTGLRPGYGEFDVVVDYGTFDDLSTRQRRSYVEHILPLTRAGTKFLLWCFEWEPRLWERIVTAIIPGGMLLRPGEAKRWFAPYFDIEQVGGESGLRSWPAGWGAYLMTRRPGS
jgi:cyclopropane fatty-acyl-phospholipid synthase-like methyltransferase